MRVCIENNIIRIRRNGLFLCIDGNSWGNYWIWLYEFIKFQCEDFDIPFKIGLLSWDKEVEGFPNEVFLSLNNIQKKGRFITPLVEGIFSKLREKDYDIIILSSDKIYDLNDWHDEISSKFNKEYRYNLRDFEQKTREQIEETLLSELFNFEINDVTLYFEDGLCYEFPDGFLLKIEKGKFVLTKNFKKRHVEINLKTCGLKKDTKFVLEACNLKIESRIGNSLVEPVYIDKEFDQNKRKIFLNSIEEYMKKKFEHDCPLCKTKHMFSKAFMCDQQSSTRLFSTECIIFNEIEAERRMDSKFVAFYHKNNRVYWGLLNQPVVYINNNEFIVGPENGKIFYVRISDKFDIFEFKEIHRGLYYYPDGVIYILNLR